LTICNDTKSKIPHIFSKRNDCGDKLANLGLVNREQFKWYPFMSLSMSIFFYDRYRLPMYRIV